MTATPGSRPAGARSPARGDRWRSSGLAPSDGPPAGQADDESRFAELYPGLRSFAAVVADDDVDPDDLVQEALVQVLRRHRLAELDNPAAYLRRSVVNAAANERRRLGRRRKALRRLPSGDPEAEPPSYPSDLADLSRLSAQDRAVLYLLEIEGFSAAEVGQQLDLSANAVLVRASRARRRLRDELRAEPTTGPSAIGGET